MFFAFTKSCARDAFPWYRQFCQRATTITWWSTSSRLSTASIRWAKTSTFFCSCSTMRLCAILWWNIFIGKKGKQCARDKVGAASMAQSTLKRLHNKPARLQNLGATFLPKDFFINIYKTSQPSRCQNMRIFKIISKRNFRRVPDSQLNNISFLSAALKLVFSSALDSGKFFCESTRKKRKKKSSSKEKLDWSGRGKAGGQSRSCAKADDEKRWKNWEAACGWQRRCEHVVLISPGARRFIVSIAMQSKREKLMKKSTEKDSSWRKLINALSIMSQRHYLTRSEI